MNINQKNNVSFNNTFLHRFKAVISIFVVFLLLTTVATSVVGSANIGGRIENIKEKANNIVENIQEVKSQGSLRDRISSRFSKSSLLDSFRTLSSIRASAGSMLNFYTKYNDIEKTSQLKFFRFTDIDVNNDKVNDISAKLSLRLGIERPFALSVNFGLTINKLDGFGDDNAFFRAYAEVVFPGTVKSDMMGDKIFFGYQSSDGERVPDSCVVTYKYVPYIINPLKKPDHKLDVSLSGDVVGKADLDLILSYVDSDGGQEDEFRVCYSPAVETSISFGRASGRSFEFVRERAGSSKVDLYLTHKKDGNVSYGYVFDLPGHVSFVLDFGRDGCVEFDTHGEKASEIGVCDKFVNPSFKIFFTDLPTKAGVEWHRRLLRGEVEIKVYCEGTDGVNFNILYTGQNGTKFYGSCRVKANQDSPFTMTYGDRLDGKAEISLSKKSFEVSNFEANLFIPGKGAYSVGFDQFIKQKEGSVNISVSIKKYEGTRTILDVTIKVVNGVEIHGVKIGFNGSLVPVLPPFNNIETDGDKSYHFTLTIEGITIKIGDGWGYILIKGSLTLTSYRPFEYNGIHGAIKGTFSILSGGFFNLSWKTVDSKKVFNLDMNLVSSISDFDLWYGDKIYLTIEELVGSIEIIDARYR